MYIFIPVIKNKQTKKLSTKGTEFLEYLSEDSSEIPIIKKDSFPDFSLLSCCLVNFYSQSIIRKIIQFLSH